MSNLREAGSEFSPEIYKVKGLTDEGIVLCGHLHMRYGEIPCISQFSPDEPSSHTEWWEVSPYTLCRNTGIPAGKDYFYEFDLISYREPMGSKDCMGYITFDLFSNSWCVRTSFNFSSKRGLRSCVNAAVIGNVMLSDEDAKRFQKYSDAEECGYRPEPNVECRSTQHLNRQAKQFLPK